MSSRNARTGGGGYTAHVERPSKQGAVSSRAVWGLILTVLLPPVGLMFLWHRGVFRTRGRMERRTNGP